MTKIKVLEYTCSTKGIDELSGACKEFKMDVEDLNSILLVYQGGKYIIQCS